MTNDFNQDGLSPIERKEMIAAAHARAGPRSAIDSAMRSKPAWLVVIAIVVKMMASMGPAPKDGPSPAPPSAATVIADREALRVQIEERCRQYAQLREAVAEALDRSEPLERLRTLLPAEPPPTDVLSTKDMELLRRETEEEQRSASGLNSW